MSQINVEHYCALKPEVAERTKERLDQLIELGLETVATAQFGIPDLFSGIYIEHVWNEDEVAWEKTIEFINCMKRKKEKQSL